MTPTPPSTPTGREVPAAPAPSLRQAPAVLRPLVAVVGLVRRQPGRCAAVLLLLVVTGFGLAVGGTQLWAAYHLRAARAALDRYHNAEAGDHLDVCLGVWPNDPAVLFLAARAARRSGLFDAAEGFLGRYQELRGRDDELTLERALLTAERGDVDDVMTFCTARVEANDPDAPLILEALARGCLRAYRLADADLALRTWQDRDEGSAMLHLLRGRLARERLAEADAAVAFRRALEIDPELDEARDHLTAILVETHQSPEALPHLEYLVRRRPREPSVAVRLAQCRDLLGQQDEAARLLDDVLARFPNFPTALVERGKLALEVGQDAEAEVWLRKALVLAPGDAAALSQLHKCLTRTGQADQARELEPRIKEANDDLERIQVLVGQDIQRAPHNAELQYEAGTILLRMGVIPDGLRWLQNAVRLNPRHVKAHEALADFYRRTGDTGKAARHRQLARQAAERND